MDYVCGIAKLIEFCARAQIAVQQMKESSRGRTERLGHSVIRGLEQLSSSGNFSFDNIEGLNLAIKQLMKTHNTIQAGTLDPH